MLTFYDTHISPEGMARDNAFRALRQCAKLRASAATPDMPRWAIIVHARHLLFTARASNDLAQVYGHRLP